MGKVWGLLSESLRERADALYKTHTITNGYGVQSTPQSLETLSKQFIAKSGKKSFKVPLKTTSQLNEFLLHNPGIIEPDKLDWDYEDDQQSHDGSYSPIDDKRTMTTPPQTSPLDLSTSPKRSNMTVPGAPMSTPRRGTVNIREANWRWGRSNIQSASDILKRDVIDWRRVNLPPGTKLPTQVYGEIPPYPCKYCNMKHIGRICPCGCGWIHLTEECPEIPYEPPKEEEPEYQVGPCWSYGQQGNFTRTCPNVETSTKKVITKFNPKYEEAEWSYEGETTPYHVEITKPQMIGHLSRPGSGVLKDKTKTGPKQAFLPNKPSKGTPRKEQASDRRGAQRLATSPPSDKPQGYTGGSGGGAPGGRPPGKGPPGGNGEGGDDDHHEDDDEDNEDD